MASRALRTTLRFMIQHPWLSLIGLILGIAAISLAFGGEDQGSNPVVQRPGQSTPSNEAPAPSYPDDGPVSLTPAPSAEQAPLVSDKRYSYVNKLEHDNPGAADPEPEAPQPTLQLPEDVNPYRPTPDPYDVSPDHQADATSQHLSQPAVQHLPFSGRTIYADIADRSPDNRVIIVVRYSRSLASAKNEWRRFLNKQRDSGNAYIVLYRR